MAANREGKHIDCYGIPPAIPQTVIGTAAKKKQEGEE
jgi:hypothetical protein